MTPTMETYKGYKITNRTTGAAVFDPRWPRDPAIYRTGTVADARKWIDAYREGRYWADAARQ